MKTQYRCLRHQQFYTDKYLLEPLRHRDIQKIKEWRNAQMDILRQNAPLTDAGQEVYFNDVVIPTFKAQKPEQVLLSYLYDGQCIGYGGLVRVDWDRKQAEVSFLVAPERAADEETYRQDFSNFLKLIKNVAFNDMHLKRLYTETYDIRPLHISVLESQSFALEERLKDHIVKDGKTLDSLIHGCTPHG